MPNSPQKKAVISTSTADSLVNMDQWSSAANDESAQSFLKSTLQSMLKTRSRELHLEQEADFCRVRVRVNGRLTEQKNPNPNLVSDLLHALASSATAHGPVNIKPTEAANEDFGELNIPVQIEGEQCSLAINHYTTAGGKCLTLTVNAELAIPETLDQTRLDALTRKLLRQHFGATATQGITVVCSESEDTLRSVYYALLGEVNHVERKIISLQNTIYKRVPRISQIHVSGEEHFNSLATTVTKHADHLFVDWSCARHAGLFQTLSGNTPTTIFWKGKLTTSVLQLFATATRSSYELGSLIEMKDIGLICPHCAETYKPHRDDFVRLPARSKSKQKTTASYFYANGCSRCDYTGVESETTITSICECTDAIRESISTSSLVNTEQAIAQSQGSGSITAQLESLVWTGQVSFEDWLKER